MSELDMDPATLPADARALYEKMAARRKAQGEGFGGPYLALLNHPELARRIEELGFFLKFEGALPRTIYQFIVLTVARATGAGFEWHDHIAQARIGRDRGAVGILSDVRRDQSGVRHQAGAESRVNALIADYAKGCRR